ncbi:MAG: class II aldolase/adducin family protein [bacterium]|nr:class II aldolase/adducin family protein [bacterium]MCX7917789.1 class II aldolase/adducin family protein [bacterium]MDW8164453.1 class II aldolase/adducin family protein [Candidatus Omnitrophota bacterium]
MNSLKEEVLKANIFLWKNNLVYGTQGNVSGIDNEKKIIYIKPSGIPYEELTESKIVGIDLNGIVIEGNLKPSVDTPHHLYIYKNIKEAKGICHTHSKFICVFSVLGISIPVITTAHADVFGKEIPVSKYVDNRGDNIGREILKVYEKTQSPVIILRNHGLFCFGDSPEKASFYALISEYFAEIFYYTLIAEKILNKKIKQLPKKEIKKWYNRYHSDRYGQKK